ncbi:MAG: hypothetical protein D3924_13470, partial [Candidatus Electrothrix sp. AR4]|nr:hypothetical protein [Candidatus Electrothrix sp. AR4]
ADDQNSACAVANKELDHWLRLIPKKDLAHYGFLNEGEFSTATLDKPIPVYYIDFEQIRKYKGEDISSFLSPFSDRWIFPIKVASQIRLFLTVARTNDLCKVVEIGRHRVAVQLNSLKSKLAADINLHRLKFITVLTDSSRLIFLLSGEENKNLKLIPLESARVFLHYGSLSEMKKESLKPEDILFKLKKLIQQ